MKYVKIEITEEMESQHDDICSENGDNCEDCTFKIGEDDCIFSHEIIEEIKG